LQFRDLQVNGFIEESHKLSNLKGRTPQRDASFFLRLSNQPHGVRLFPTRRTFLQQISAAGLAWGARRSIAQQMAMPKPQAVVTLRCNKLTPFVDPLPLPATARPNAAGHIRIPMREVHAKIHRDVTPTRFWSYGDTALAPLIEARSGQPLRVEWVNQLPTKHFLPVDFSLHGCGHDIPEVRACVHLHGGRTPSKDDGQPDDWYVPGHANTSTYPLQQDAAALWYHDHAMGLNRLNMYAGLVGMAIVRDDVEDALHLPSGKYEVPLTIYDRLFSEDGQLYYPTSSDPEHPWVSEFAGDGILVNGKIKPYLEVEPRMYRFRIVNAANSTFFTLSLSGGQPFHQIGTDQGLLSAPHEIKRLSMAPAERADLLIDFSQAAGHSVHLVNNLQETLQFRVAKAPAAISGSVPSKLRAVTPIPESSAAVTRTITLNEYLDHIGNSMLMVLNQKRWHEPVTETPKLNSTEIWEFVNLTEDTHPMHLHLVRFQVLDRRVFDVFAYRNNKGLRYLSAALPTEPNDTGWKDVVHCPPGVVTRIIMKFEGYTGKYLYHCHILEHEANDMMRPFEVVA
jgi:spore coat protein A